MFTVSTILIKTGNQTPHIIMAQYYNESLMAKIRITEVQKSGFLVFEIRNLDYTLNPDFKVRILLKIRILDFAINLNFGF